MQKIKIRCRGIISHEGKVLFVRHAPDHTFYCLPGGHLEYGEDPRECIERELFEELGVRGMVGRLLYVHTFKNSIEEQTVEFFFVIENSVDFIVHEQHMKTHAHEIAEVVWLAQDDTRGPIRPECIQKFLHDNTLIHGEDVRFLKS